MSKEETESAAGWAAYKGFIKAAGGYLVYMGVILSFSLTVGADLVSKWWLSHWLNAGDGVRRLYCYIISYIDLLL